MGAQGGRVTRGRGAGLGPARSISNPTHRLSGCPRGPGVRRRPCAWGDTEGWGGGLGDAGSGPDITHCVLQKHVVETFFGFDEESVDSETLSETSCNTDRTDRAPATPEEDVDDVSSPTAEVPRGRL